MLNFLFFLVLGCLLIVLLTPIIRKHLLEWRRKRKYSTIINDIHALYQDIDPYQLSLQARAHQPILSTSLTYGEIDLCALLDLLEEVQYNQNDVFYDLGSGIGKTLLAVKLCYPTLDVRGIEIVPLLHDAAIARYHAYIHSKKCEPSDFTLTHILDNFLTYNFSDADIIFVNATGYTDAEFDALLAKLLNLKPRTKIIVTSKALPETAFQKKYQGMEKMSWGLTSTYIYEKKH